MLEFLPQWLQTGAYVQAHWSVQRDSDTIRVPLGFPGGQFSPVKELLVGLAEGKARPAHAHVLQEPQVLHLVPAALIIKYLRGLLVIGFDAAHVVGLLEKWQQTVSLME